MTAQSASWRWLGLLGWIAVCFVPSAMAVFVEPGAWYAALEKPAWTPPAWVFAPVWTALYLLMGIAAWRVWDRFGFAHARLELVLFLVHLIFNAAWTWLRGDRDRDPMVYDCGDHHAFLAARSAGRRVARAVPGVGHVRGHAQHRVCCAQLTACTGRGQRGSFSRVAGLLLVQHFGSASLVSGKGELHGWPRYSRR
jgi:hypothetical protein